LEILKEKQRQEEEERKAVEKARRELEEQERRKKLDEQRAQEEERKRQEAIKREEEETRRKAEAQRQRESEETARKDQQAKEDADKKARQDAEAKQKQQQAEQERQKAAQQPPQPFPQLNGTLTSVPAVSSSTQPAVSSQSSSAPANIPPGLVSSPNERQTVHNKYLDLHKRLKPMRQHVIAEAKKVPGLKDQVSDWRRKIQKCCGQLGKGSGDDIKATNKRAVSPLHDRQEPAPSKTNLRVQMMEIIEILDAAAQVSNPSIDITQYLVQNEQPAGATTHGPGILLFLLNQFAKKIISQFISESAVDPETADVIGILAVTVFARPQYLFNGQSLIDVLWAKYHKVCPVLFGITGNEKTKEGRMKLGWHVESGAFVRDQEHYDRNSGLGAGFAAMGLRDFSKSKNSNPVPNRIYWESLARILNTPPQAVQSTHCVVLKAMIQNSVPRILTMFGGAGLAALRQALISFPNEKGPVDESGKKVPAAVALQAMPLVLQREQHLTL
jgi:nucleoporin GLE1